MSTVLILTPVIVASWPAITAAVGAAAAAMGMAARQSVKDSVHEGVSSRASEEDAVEIEMEESQVASEAVAAKQEIVVTRGTVKLRVRRNAQGRCCVCAEGAGHSKTELRALAEEFSRKMAQCLIYDKVMSELRAKGFQVVNEEQMEDESVRIHVRRWEE